jgi:hypothetical protein
MKSIHHVLPSMALGIEAARFEDLRVSIVGKLQYCISIDRTSMRFFWFLLRIPSSANFWVVTPLFF